MSQYFFNPWSIPYLVAFILLFIVVSIFLSRISRDGKLILYTISLAFMALATLSAFLASNSNEVEVWNVWVALIFFFGLISMSSFCQYSFLYKENLGLKDKKFLYALYAFPLAFILVFLIDRTILYPDLIERVGAFGKFEIGQLGVFNYIDIIWGALYFLLIVLMFIPLFNFAKVFRNTNDKLERKRAAFFIIGYLFPFLGIPLDYTLVSIFNVEMPVMISMVSLSFTGILFLIGILSEKLLDPSIFVTKALKYIITAVTVSFIFAILKELIVEFIAHNFFENGQVSSFLSVLFAVIILFPIHGAVEKLFHRRKEHTEPSAVGD